jgi:hypothetical protein
MALALEWPSVSQQFGSIEGKRAADFLPSVTLVVVVIAIASPVTMVAIRVISVMMVSIPVVAVMSPVAVSTVFVVIVSVSAMVSLVAITILVVVAFMVATRIHNYRRSDLDADV